MKYTIVVDDEFLSNFRVDDCGKTLVLTDKNGLSRAVDLKPLQRPVITFQTGESLYLTQGHIDALLEYEQQKSLAEAVRRVNQSIEEMKNKSVGIPKVEPIAIGSGCLKCPSHVRCTDAFQIHSHMCNHYDKTEEEFKDWLKSGIR